MTRDELLGKILRAHRHFFDVEEGHAFAGHVFPGYAEYHAHSEQYVLSKRAKIWEADAHQYLFFESVERLDLALLESLVGFMRQKAIAKVNPMPNHMSSDLCLVVVADEVDEDAAGALKRVRFRKNYKLGLQGWTDLKLAAIDLAGKRVVTNGAGREMRQTLEANAWPANPGREAVAAGGLAGRRMA